MGGQMSSVKITPIKRKRKALPQEYPEDRTHAKIELLVLPSKSVYEIEFPTELTIGQLTGAIVRQLNLERRYWELRWEMPQGRYKSLYRDDSFDDLFYHKSPQRFVLIPLTCWP